LNEYTVELEIRPARSGWVPDQKDVSALLSAIEAGGRFLGPVLSVSATGSIRVLGQIKAVHVNDALRIGQIAFQAAFIKNFGDFAWDVVAVAPFSPDWLVESIPTPV
jgi:hypothetical protein